MRLKEIIRDTVGTIVLITLGFSSCFASTIWGVTGDKIKGGGTIVAKNFDYRPSCDVKLIFKKPADGYKYLAAVVYEEGAEPIMLAGINEKGVSVMSASAPVKKTVDIKSISLLNEMLLSSYYQVNSLLEDRDILSKYGPGFYMVSDKSNIIMIEIAPEGRYKIDATMNGFLYHANHYLSDDFSGFNLSVSTGSWTRAERIKALVSGHQGFFTQDDFISFSQDRHDGPNRSIWRTGKPASAERTIATWVLNMPGGGWPELYMRKLNSKGKPVTVKITLNWSFWHTQNEGEISF